MKMNFELTLPLKAQFLDRRNQATEQNYVGPGLVDVVRGEAGLLAEEPVARRAERQPAEVRKAQQPVEAKKSAQPVETEKEEQIAEAIKKKQTTEAAKEEATPSPPEEPRPELQPAEPPTASPTSQPPPPKRPAIIPDKVFDTDSAKTVRKFQDRVLKIKERYLQKELLELDLPEDVQKSHPKLLTQILRIQDKFYQIQSDMLEVIDSADDITSEVVSLALICGGYKLEKTPSFKKAVHQEVVKTERAYESKIRLINKAFNMEIEEQKKVLQRQVTLTEELMLRNQELEEEVVRTRKEAEKTRGIFANSKVTIDTKMKNFEELNRFIIDVLEDKKKLNSALEAKSNQILDLRREVIGLRQQLERERVAEGESG